LNTDTINSNPAGNSLATYIFIDDVSLTLIPCSSVDISNYNNSPTIKTFPNPATSQLTVSNDDKEPSELIIYDMLSRKLIEQTFTGSVILNIEGLEKGMYIYEVRGKQGSVKGKVVKE
jgi:hypothetical protein